MHIITPQFIPARSVFAIGSSRRHGEVIHDLFLNGFVTEDNPVKAALSSQINGQCYGVNTQIITVTGVRYFRHTTKFTVVPTMPTGWSDSRQAGLWVHFVIDESAVFPRNRKIQMVLEHDGVSLDLEARSPKAYKPDHFLEFAKVLKMRLHYHFLLRAIRQMQRAIAIPA